MNRCCWMHYFFHSEYVYHLNEMSNPISDVKNFIIQLIWGFKIHHSFLYNQYIGLFWHLCCLDPHLSLDHSCLHEIHRYSLSFSTAHPCPSRMTALSDRKMLLYYWPPVDGDIFYTFFIASAAEDLPHKDCQIHRKSGRLSLGLVICG